MVFDIVVQDFMGKMVDFTCVSPQGSNIDGIRNISDAA